MLGWLGNLFNAKESTEKVLSIAEKTTSGVVAGIDALFFTDEEKSHASQKAIETYIELMKTTANENSTRSMTRRILAIMVMGTFLLFLIAGAIIWRFNTEWAMYVLGNAKTLSNLALAVGVFYFGPYQIGKAFSKKGG